MPILSPAALIEQLTWRYAVKEFDPAKRISPEHWRALEQALVLAPSSFGLQPWKFWVVHDPAIRDKLVEASWGQTQIRDASHLVVLAVKLDMALDHVDRYLIRQVEVRGGSVEALAGYRKIIAGFLQQPPELFNVNEWASRQVYIALGQFMAAAAVLGIDTCPMEGILPAKYDEVLGLSESGYATCVVATAGYRAADDKSAAQKKVRFLTEQVVEHVGKG